MNGRSTLRRRSALVTGASVALLVFLVGTGPAAARTQAQQPTELWQEYPLDPQSEQGADVSVESVRSVQLAEFVPLVKPESSSDSALLVGGLVLVLLLISDTSFLVLTRRVLARSEDDY